MANQLPLNINMWCPSTNSWAFVFCKYDLPSFRKSTISFSKYTLPSGKVYWYCSNTCIVAVEASLEATFDRELGIAQLENSYMRHLAVQAGVHP